MKFLNFKKSAKVEKNDDPSQLHIRPYRDWRIMFSVFFFLLVVSVAIHVYVFLLVSKGELFKVPPQEVSNEATFNVNLLNAVIEHFDSKTARMKEIIGE